MNHGDRSRKRISILYCLAQMLYWGSGFTTVGYATAYLAGLGFSNASIGLITAVAGLAGFVLAFCLSIRIDKIGLASLHCTISVILLLQIVLIAFFASSRYVSLLHAVLYSCFLAHGHVLNSLFSKLYMDLKKRGIQIDFGIARGLGSLSFAGSSFAVGYMIGRCPTAFVHYFTLAFYALLLLATMLIHKMCDSLSAGQELPSSSAEGKTVLRTGAFFRDYRLFVLVVLGISLVTASNKTFTTFLVNVVEGLGGDIRAFTTISGFLALIEIPVMLFFSKLRRRSSISSMLLISLLLYAVKLGGAAAANSLPVLFLAVSAQTFAAGLYHPASVEFVRETIPHEDTAKCQALLDGMPVFISFLTITGFGALLDYVSAKTACLVLFLLALFGTFICRSVISALKSDAAAT